jgi:hypothetical protein
MPYEVAATTGATGWLQRIQGRDRRSTRSAISAKDLGPRRRDGKLPFTGLTPVEPTIGWRGRRKKPPASWSG